MWRQIACWRRSCLGRGRHANSVGSKLPQAAPTCLGSRRAARAGVSCLPTCHGRGSKIRPRNNLDGRASLRAKGAEEHAREIQRGELPAKRALRTRRRLAPLGGLGLLQHVAAVAAAAFAAVGRGSMCSHGPLRSSCERISEGEFLFKVKWSPVTPKLVGHAAELPATPAWSPSRAKPHACRWAAQQRRWNGPMPLRHSRAGWDDTCGSSYRGHVPRSTARMPAGCIPACSSRRARDETGLGDAAPTSTRDLLAGDAAQGKARGQCEHAFPHILFTAKAGSTGLIGERSSWNLFVEQVSGALGAFLLCGL